ncbi:amidase [Actinomarinicola tropica]|uniref:Amidase n=1 Tax=Actinomarinicola tropica TaxID=2789776 RepID=A0A5Q2RNP8_9ACTN|nr:amidase [Actinomarinicola tropica]
MPLTIQDAAAALRDGSLSSVGLTETLLERIEQTQDTLGAFVTDLRDQALDAASVADAELAAGVDKGVLHGVPLAIKDIIAVAGAPTTANSRILDPEWGGDADAPVAARLREAGAVFIGKATTSEFALGAPDPEKGFPIPRNPWNLEHTPAGSSSGTGIAVAAGLALGGLGTDTGGSVRGPACVNGHTGLKVTFGRVPKSGVVPLGYTLDSVGPMARSAWDCAALLEVIAGHHPSDRFAADVPVPAYTELLTGSAEGMRIGVPRDYFFDAEGLDDEVRDSVLAAIDVLRDGGAEVVDVDLPYAKEAKEANTQIMVAEAFAYHRTNLAERWTTYGAKTRPLLARGAFYSAGDHVQALRFRTWFRRTVAEVMSDVDVLITPSAPTPPERIDEMDMDRRLAGPSFTGQWNLTGQPAAAVPVGFSATGLPLSMQVVGKPFAEATVLGVAHAYQQVTRHHLAVPALPAPAVVAA